MTDVTDIAAAFIARAETEAGVVLPESKQIMLRAVFESVVRDAGMSRSPEATRPLGPTEVARLLLQRHAASRSGLDHSSVKLVRNAKGDTQIEVTVRTGDTDDEPATVADAAITAKSVYDTLRGFYPQSGTDHAD